MERTASSPRYGSALTPTTKVVFDNTLTPPSPRSKLGAGGGPWHGHLKDVEAPENPNFRRPHAGDNLPDDGLRRGESAVLRLYDTATRGGT